MSLLLWQHWQSLSAIEQLGKSSKLSGKELKEAEEKAEASLPKTEVGKLLAKDLDLEYPGTPTEVVKLFWRINKCLYNTNMKEKDQKALFQQLRRLYDD